MFGNKKNNIRTGDFTEIDNDIIIDEENIESQDSKKEDEIKKSSKSSFGGKIGSFFSISNKRKKKEAENRFIQDEELKRLEKEEAIQSEKEISHDDFNSNNEINIEDNNDFQEQNNSNGEFELDNNSESKEKDSFIIEEDNIQIESSKDNIIKEKKDYKAIIGNKVNQLKQNPFVQKMLDKFNNKTKKIDKDVLILFINESFISLLIIGLMSFASYQVYQVSQLDFNKIQKYYQVEKEIKEEKEKIRLNKEFKELADILKFGVEQNGVVYPYGGYLHAFENIFPTDLSDLNILTFLEGWSSDFYDYEGRNIRIDNELIQTFTKQGEKDYGNSKGIEFQLQLNGEKSKINTFLSNLLYTNKIPKSITSISEVNNPKDNTLNVTLSIVFYISKGIEKEG